MNRSDVAFGPIDQFLYRAFLCRVEQRTTRRTAGRLDLLDQLLEPFLVAPAR